ncbi:MAG TPA: hypothetical protein VGR22_01750, partial [Thermomicrobiales bacterium]|nr:hypothetical protein [Thermomicrobiales bacterium]
IGAGYISAIYLENFTTRFANLRVVGIADLVPEHARRQAERFGVAAMASFPLAKMRLRFNRVLFLLFIAGAMIPVHVTLIPIYTLTNRIGIYDSLLGTPGAVRCVSPAAGDPDPHRVHAPAT